MIWTVISGEQCGPWASCFYHHNEVNQVNFRPFSGFELRTPGVYRSVPPNVHLGTGYIVHARELSLAETNIR